MGRLAAAAFALAACALLGACASAPRLPARGHVGATRVDTTVDSPIARYFLESYLAGRADDPAMDERIREIHRRYPQPLPGRDELAAIARETSVDFAALFLAARILADDCNRRVNLDFARHLARRDAPPPAPSPYLLLFAPGWDYVDNGSLTGADLARPRQLAARFGFRNELAPFLPRGTIEANARILAAEIEGHARAGNRLLIASASSAGPAVLMALGELVSDAGRASVAGWLNIGGILQGSPVVEYLQSGPPRIVFELGLLWTGWDRDAVLSLGTTRGRPRFERQRLDPRILVVNYLAVPLSGHIGPHSRENYPVLARDGPNDGLTLLADAIAPGGLTVLAIGSDHFFAEDASIDVKAVALMRLMQEYLARSPAERCRPASVPSQSSISHEPAPRITAAIAPSTG